MWLPLFKKVILPLLLLLAGSGLRAQYSASELSAYANNVTESVRITLEGAAEKNVTDPNSLQELLRRASGESGTETKEGVMPLQAFVREHLCDAPPAVRA